MKTAIFALGLMCGLPLLSGCADQQANNAAIEAADDAECRKFGEPGTTSYNRCRANKGALRDRMAPSPGAL
jgi:hypothetical protein